MGDKWITSGRSRLKFKQNHSFTKRYHESRPSRTLNPVQLDGGHPLKHPYMRPLSDGIWGKNYFDPVSRRGVVPPDSPRRSSPIVRLQRPIRNAQNFYHRRPPPPHIQPLDGPGRHAIPQSVPYFIPPLGHTAAVTNHQAFPDRGYEGLHSQYYHREKGIFQDRFQGAYYPIGSHDPMGSSNVCGSRKTYRPPDQIVYNQEHGEEIPFGRRSSHDDVFQQGFPSEQYHVSPTDPFERTRPQGDVLCNESYGAVMPLYTHQKIQGYQYSSPVLRPANRLETHHMSPIKFATPASRAANAFDLGHTDASMFHHNCFESKFATETKRSSPRSFERAFVESFTPRGPQYEVSRDAHRPTIRGTHRSTHLFGNDPEQVGHDDIYHLGHGEKLCDNVSQWDAGIPQFQHELPAMSLADHIARNKRQHYSLTEVASLSSQWAPSSALLSGNSEQVRNPDGLMIENAQNINTRDGETFGFDLFAVSTSEGIARFQKRRKVEHSASVDTPALQSLPDDTFHYVQSQYEQKHGSLRSSEIFGFDAPSGVAEEECGIEKFRGKSHDQESKNVECTVDPTANVLEELLVPNEDNLNCASTIMLQTRLQDDAPMSVKGDILFEKESEKKASEGRLQANDGAQHSHDIMTDTKASNDGSNDLLDAPVTSEPQPISQSFIRFFNEGVEVKMPMVSRDLAIPGTKRAFNAEDSQPADSSHTTTDPSETTDDPDLEGKKTLWEVFGLKDQSQI